MADNKPHPSPRNDDVEQQPTLLQRLTDLALSVPHFIRDEIWRVRSLEARSWKGRCFGLLRMSALTIEGIRANRLAVQAASLGYYTLIALGPLVAIAIMISSFVIRENSKEKIVDALTELTYFIAPPAEQAALQSTFTTNGNLLHGINNLPDVDDELAGVTTPATATLSRPNFTAGTAPSSTHGSDGLSHPLTPGHIHTPGHPVTPPAANAAVAGITGAPDAIAKAAVVQAQQKQNEEEAKEEIQPSSHLVNIINELVTNARSGTVGIVGSLTLIVISIGLIGNIEKTFNAIWGVGRGRSLIQQVFIYWTLITLGAVLGAAALTLGLANIAASTFEQLPLGGTFLKDLFLQSSSFLAFLLVVFLLSSFYRFIPNTRVHWQPSLVGGLIVALLLYANQFFSFLYIGFVVRQGSLFGAVGILPVLLFGLFIFWLLILLGGQITYAIQNVNTLTHQRVWDNVSHRTQELLALTTLLLVGRRYESCSRPYSAAELAQRIRVPANVLNSTLNSLCSIGYLCTVTSSVRSGRDEDTQDRYQPGRPLNRITLAEFKQTFEKWGNNDGAVVLRDLDPLLAFYSNNLLKIPADNAANQSLQALFAEYDPYRLHTDAEAQPAVQQG